MMILHFCTSQICSNAESNYNFHFSKDGNAQNLNNLFLGPFLDFEESPSLSPKFIYESLSIEIGE